MQSPKTHLFYPTVTRLALPSKNGFTFVRTDTIVRCQADGNYAYIFLSNGKKEVVCRKLKELEATLAPYDIIRVHHGHLVNLNFVHRYERHKQRRLILTNGDVVEVSASRQKELMEKFRFV